MAVEGSGDRIRLSHGVEVPHRTDSAVEADVHIVVRSVSVRQEGIGGDGYWQAGPRIWRTQEGTNQSKTPRTYNRGCTNCNSQEAHCLGVSGLAALVAVAG